MRPNRKGMQNIEATGMQTAQEPFDCRVMWVQRDNTWEAVKIGGTGGVPGW